MRLPAKNLAGPRDIGATTSGVIRRQTEVLHRRRGPRELSDEVSEFEHGDLLGITQVHRVIGGRLSRQDEAAHEVGDEAQAARLGPVAVDGEGLATQGLDDEVGDHSPIARGETWPVGIENTHHAHGELVVTVVGVRNRFAEALGFVVDRARTRGIDVAPVVLGLRVNERIAVHLRGRGHHERGPRIKRHIERAASALAAHGQSGEGASEVGRRRRGRGEVVHDVELAVHVDVLRDVTEQKLHSPGGDGGLEVAAGAGGEIVDHDDVMRRGREGVDEVRTDETRATRDEHSHRRPNPR